MCLAMEKNTNELNNIGFKVLTYLLGGTVTTVFCIFILEYITSSNEHHGIHIYKSNIAHIL